MGASFNDVRRMAAELPGVTEGVCFGTPALYVGRKLMARMWEDDETLVLKVDPERRQEYLDRDPDVYFLTEHYRNYPTMLVNLLAVSQADLAAAVEGAWNQAATAKWKKVRK